MNSRRGSGSRVEVPFTPRTPPRRQQPKQPYVGETNRALVNGGIIVISTLVTTVLLLAISGQVHDSTSATLVSQSASPLVGSIAFSPTPEATVSPSPSPGKAKASPTPAEESPTPETPPDDSEIQAAIDSKLEADQSLSGLGITATVNGGKVVLVGTAPSDAVKARVEKMVRAVSGVKQVDNQIAVVIN
jgi:hypothetical protein